VVNLFFEDTEVLDLNPDFFALWLSKVCVEHKRELGEINLIFCSDEYLLELNIEHLNHVYYTDIITFDYYEKLITGDLFISVDRCSILQAQQKFDAYPYPQNDLFYLQYLDNILDLYF
jgi:probable rRNA maturation factor